MAGLLEYSTAGLALGFIGAADSLSSFIPSPFISLFRSLAVAALSSLQLLNALLSAFSAHAAGDPLGAAAQLSNAAFLLFRTRSPDSPGVENRYYDLALVTVAASAAAALLSAAAEGSPLPRLIRGLGTALQGTWFLQMGFSFFSTAVAHGCSLRRRSRASFTVLCRGHAEYHRGRAVATLQFNGHLALLVVTCLAVYAAAVGGGGERRRPKYELVSEMERLGRESSGFGLDSEEEDRGAKPAVAVR
ncbi:plant viral-response family protein (DUF716) [Wolffia australiana]